MIIEITSHEQTITVNLADNQCTLDEVVDTFKGMLVCAGFHPESIDSYFNTGNEWFPEKEQSTVNFETIH